MVSHPDRGPPPADAPAHLATAVASGSSRIAYRHALRRHPSSGRRSRCAPHPGVLSLAKKYGPAAVDEACAAALEMGVQEYRFVRRYLERHPQAPLSLQQVDPLIRELVQYRDLIDYRTKEVEE